MFLLSGYMTFVVAGIATLVAIGHAPELLALWGRDWITAWEIASPALLIVRPLVHRMKGSETTRLRDPPE